VAHCTANDLFHHEPADGEQYISQMATFKTMFESFLSNQQYLVTQLTTVRKDLDTMADLTKSNAISCSKIDDALQNMHSMMTRRYNYLQFCENILCII